MTVEATWTHIARRSCRIKSRRQTRFWPMLPFVWVHFMDPNTSRLPKSAFASMVSARRNAITFSKVRAAVWCGAGFSSPLIVIFFGLRLFVCLFGFFLVVAADVAEAQDKRAGAVALPVRKLEEAADQASAGLFSRGVPEEQVGVGRLAFIMKDYCGGSMSSFVSCAKKNRFNTSKCKREAGELLDCYNGFESMKLEAQLYPPQSGK